MLGLADTTYDGTDSMIRHVFARAVALLLLGALVACGGGGGGSSAQLRFLIAGSTPASNALGVPLTAVVTITFNQALNEATVAPDTIVVSPLAGGDDIAGLTSLVDDGSALSIRWVSSEVLSEDASYTCTVSPGLRGDNGATLAPPTSFRFSTTTLGGALGIPNQSDLRTLGTQLVRGRQAHEATRLGDGRVLVTGGYTIGTSVTDSAELFNPANEQFAELALGMTVPRAGHTATALLDGRILICGGYTPVGVSELGTTATAELYNPATGLFAAVGTMGEERADHAAALLPDGRVLVTGGSRLAAGFLTDSATAEIFDPTTGAFTPHPTGLLHTRATHGLIGTGGGRFVLGGGSDADLRASAYDASTGLFMDLGQGTNDRARFGAVMERFDSGGVVLAGGDTLGTVMYIPTTGGLVQNTGSALVVPRAYATATRIASDRIFVVGGLDFSRGGFIEASCDIFIEGGVAGSRTFATAVRFPVGMAFHTATTLLDGRVLYLGGVNENGALANLRGAHILTPP